MQSLNIIYNNKGFMFYVANSAVIESREIGEGTKIWHYSHVSKKAVIGKNCVIGEGVYIGPNVVIGDNCKIQNCAQIFDGVFIGDNCFIGPFVCFSNDMKPKIGKDWSITKTYVRDGVSICANATIICGSYITEDSIIGAGAIVKKKFDKNNMFYVGTPLQNIYRSNK